VKRWRYWAVFYALALVSFIIGTAADIRAFLWTAIGLVLMASAEAVRVICTRPGRVRECPGQSILSGEFRSGHLERQALRPLEEVIAEAEARAVREHRKAYGIPEPVNPESGGAGGSSTNTVHCNPGPPGIAVVAAWGPGDPESFGPVETHALERARRILAQDWPALDGSLLTRLRERRRQVWDACHELVRVLNAGGRFGPGEAAMWTTLNEELRELDRRIKAHLDLQEKIAAAKSLARSEPPDRNES
jgi:hypothetical protein